MKSLIVLWERVALECATWCCTSAHQDIKTVQVRVEQEGFSFLTITLPGFGKDFERSLDQGQVDRRLFTGFRWKGGLPRFLGGFLDLVFDRGTGTLLDDPDIDAILSIRQLTLMFGKIAIPCSPERERRAMSEFVKCEQDVTDWNKRYRTPSNYWMEHDFRRVSSLLFGSSNKGLSPLGWVDQQIRSFSLGEESMLLPKHGPGSTADKLLGNQKYDLRTWTARLEAILPYGEMCLPNWSYYDQLEGVDILEPGSEMPVKVITVPKTLKAPRIIAMEPTAMQYAQQAILGLLNEAFKRDDFLSNAIGTEDQTPNQRLACEGSLRGNLATLDLSEASDRVSNQLVRDLFRNYPHLHEAIDASRSRKADVLGHGIIPLSKFASMGSALTFPIEAMVFLTVVFLGIERELNHPLTRKDIQSFSGQVRVYGDDIIVPVDYVHSVIRFLELFGFKVNGNKSFWNGKFRESCGRDFYSGEDVSIVRVRQEWPTSRKDATRVNSLVELRNQLYFAGYWQTCSWLDREIGKILKYFPVVLPTSRVLGRHSVLGYETQRLGPQLSNPLVKGWVVRSRPPSNPLDGAGALLKCFHLLEKKATPHTGNSPSGGKDHLTRSGRDQAVSTMLGWYQAF